jgi:hypothetical protein
LCVGYSFFNDRSVVCGVWACLTLMSYILTGVRYLSRGSKTKLLQISKTIIGKCKTISRLYVLRLRS